MTPDAHLAALADAVAALSSVTADELRLDVPTCPGWTVERLLGHTGRVYGWMSIVVDDEDADPTTKGERPPPGDQVLDWYRTAARRLQGQLAAADPGRPANSWAGRVDVAWICRRAALESAVHAWDAGSARAAVGGPPVPDIPGELAVDGVDEVFEVFLPGAFDPDRFRPAGETLHLHATDAAGEWLLRFLPDRVEVSREHAKGDSAVRAPASDLFLLLWGRRTADEVEIFGDRAIVERFQGAFTV